MPSPYLSRDGDPSWSGPFRHYGTNTYSLFFDAPLEVLEGIAAREINAVSKKRKYSPVGRFVVVQLACCNDARSLATPDAGSMSTHDLGLSVPLFNPDADLTDGREFGMRLYSPYIFADSPAAVTGGREVFGYAKQLSRTEANPPLDELAKGEASPLPRSVSIDAFVNPTAGARAQWRRVIDLSVQQDAPPPAFERFLDDGIFTQLRPALEPRLANKQDVRSLLGGIGTLSVKQFRSAPDFGGEAPAYQDACAQEVLQTRLWFNPLEATARVLQDENGGSTRWTMGLHEYASLRLAARFGWTPGTTLTPFLVLQTHFDLTVG